MALDHVRGINTNGQIDCDFLTGAPLKVLSVRLHSKSHQKSSKCQNLLTEWHLELFGRNQLKKRFFFYLLIVFIGPNTFFASGTST